jgi:hypothetical protein
MKTLFSLLLVCLGFAMLGCNAVNHGPAKYVKDVWLEKEGSDAVKVSSVLADEAEKRTACKGMATFTFYESYIDMYQRNYADVVRWRLIHSMRLVIDPSDYQTKSDKGPYYESKRIGFASFATQPSSRSDGKAVVEFDQENCPRFKGVMSAYSDEAEMPW